jgi:hypothetical protein
MTGSIDTPIRDGSRDGRGSCLICGGAVSSSRARYCSRAHQQKAFRLRHQTSLPDLQRLRQDLQRRRAVAAQTVYECASCLRFVSSKSTSTETARDEELERRIPL